MKTNIEAYFRDLSSRGVAHVIYCPNPGNAGDAAIALATYQLLERCGIAYTCVRPGEDFDATGSVVVYGGGGNLGRQTYTEARSFIARHHRQAQRLIVLPHTVAGNEDLLAQLETNVDIFCREPRSFHWVREHVEQANVYLDDDVALRLDVHAVVNDSGMNRYSVLALILQGMWHTVRARAGIGETSSGVRTNLRLGISAVTQLLLARSKSAKLLALRTDVERTDVDRPIFNTDVSRVFEYGVSPRHVSQLSTAAALSYLKQFDVIETNRLHIAILAGLLGKTVRFRPNSYYKNEEIYRFSLQDRFSNIVWLGDRTSRERRNDA